MNVTIKDIAEQARVSYATVSRALNNKYGVDPETRRRVLSVAKELNYRPNAIARGLVSNRSFTLGLILPDVTNPYFPAVAAGIEAGAQERGYSVFLCNTNWDTRRETNYIKLLSERRVDGIIHAPVGNTLNEETEGLLPTVYVSNAPKNARQSSVIIDNIRGGYLATKHLIDCGYESVGFVGVSEHETMANNDRLEGYKTAFRRYGKEIKQDYIKFGDFRQETGYKIIQTMIADRSYPQAIFAENDVLAIGILHGIKDMGLRVPDDIALIGFDDISFSAYQEIQLSTISQPKERMGRLAVDLLIDEIESGDAKAAPRRVILEPELIVRKSSCRSTGSDEELLPRTEAGGSVPG
ncbi:MAG TPA: LacI family transcriptional regulator [Sediminispirochaeta sp.]|nr:LacI family transcriptional regulator [Sediminispirochaeta sp.]